MAGRLQPVLGCGWRPAHSGKKHHADAPHPPTHPPTGDHLDPAEVLAALPPGMPLAAAAGVLAPMLRDRTHRRRQVLLVKNLHRARLAGAAGVMSDAHAQHVVVDEERACPHCHLRLGGKVFVVLQPSTLPEPGGSTAGAAAGAAPAPGAAATAAMQQQQEEPDALRPPGDDGLAAATRRLQQQVAAGHMLHVLCYTCYRRLAAAAGVGSPAAAGGPNLTFT